MVTDRVRTGNMEDRYIQLIRNAEFQRSDLVSYRCLRRSMFAEKKHGCKYSRTARRLNFVQTTVRRSTWFLTPIESIRRTLTVYTSFFYGIGSVTRLQDSWLRRTNASSLCLQPAMIRGNSATPRTSASRAKVHLEVSAIDRGSL